jgi:hypothetical protein
MIERTIQPMTLEQFKEAVKRLLEGVQEHDQEDVALVLEDIADEIRED